jgi:valyl-tRNA synthetase
MTKSLGNAVDPLDIIDEFGADALRFGIISITSEGQDVYASKEKFEVGRNFANKIWNAARFTLMNLEIKPAELEKKPPKPADLSALNRWILSRLHRTIHRVTECLDDLRFNEASAVLYDFFWHQFCDWYLELAKPAIRSKETQWTLVEALDKSLRLLHPIMPFITEEIWQKIPHKGESLMVSDWPKPDNKWVDAKIEGAFDLVISEIQAIRNVRSAWQINPKDSVPVVIKATRDKEMQVLKEHSSTIVQMARVSSLQIGKNLSRPKESAVANIGRVETYVVLSGLVDIQVERQRIEGALQDVEKMIRGVHGRLQNEDFIRKAPKEIVDRERQKAEELENRKKRLQENLQVLSE